MKKKELLELIRHLPENTEVCVPGYESGYDRIQGGYGAEVRSDPNPSGEWAGEYQLVRLPEAGEDNPTVFVLHGRHDNS